jgi:hypothetical protein
MWDHTFAGRATPSKGPRTDVLTDSVRAPGGVCVCVGGNESPEAGEVVMGGVCVCGCPGAGFSTGRIRRQGGKLGAAIRRKHLSSLVDEGCASAIGRDDAKTAEGVGDEPDETIREEHAGRCSRHVRLEILQGPRLRRDHTTQSLLVRGSPICLSTPPHGLAPSLLAVSTSPHTRVVVIMFNIKWRRSARP